MEGQRPRILVIDDDAQLRKMMRRTLEPEHEIVEVASAMAALERLAAGERFDLILCDLVMPGMTGMSFHHNLGVLGRGLAERLVFVTGGPTSLEAKAFLERPNIHCIEKPFPSVAAFRGAVREHLKRVRGGGAAPRARSPR
jgi:CheY-like chemotaxis protein